MWVCVGVGEGVYLMSTSVRVELLPCVWVCGCVGVWVCVGVGEGIYLMSTSVRVELLPCVWLCGCG